MSLSYIETEFSRGSLGLKRRVSIMRCRAERLTAEMSVGVRKVISTPHVWSAAVRVTSALGVSFGLVHLAKYLLS